MSEDMQATAEAVPIDPPAALGEVDRWLAETAARVDAAVDGYTPFEIEDEQGYKDAKRQRAALRAEIASIDGDRKDMTRAVEQAVKDFKARAKDALAPLSEADEGYKAELGKWDARRAGARRDALEAHYEEFAPALAPLVPFARLCDKYAKEEGWFTRSTTPDKDAWSLERVVAGIAAGEKQIELWNLEDVDKKTLKAIYFETLDLNEAARRAQALRDQRENVRRLEEDRAEAAGESRPNRAVEAATRAMEAHRAKGGEPPEEERATYYFEFRLTAVEYADLMQFVRERVIHGKRRRADA